MSFAGIAWPVVRRMQFCWLLTIATAAGSFADEPLDLCAIPFEPQERLIQPRKMKNGDMEVDQRGHRVTVVNRNGRESIGVVSVSPRTGIPFTALCVDSTWNVTGGKWIWGKITNYSEWGYHRGGSDLFYMWRSELDPDNVAMARARETEDGWVTEAIPNGDQRGLIIPSRDPTDEYVHIMYVDQEGNAYWREMDEDPSDEHPMSIRPYIRDYPGRWVPGTYAVTCSAYDDQGRPQVALYHVQTEETQWLTDYDTDPATVVDEAQSVWAPELPEDRGLLIGYVVNGKDFLLMAQRADGKWTHMGAFEPPVLYPDNDHVKNPEFFVFEGRTYVVAQMGSETSSRDPSELWIGSAFATEPCHYRRVSTDDVRSRADPEPMVLLDKVVIYYLLRYDAGRGLIIHADTGLGSEPATTGQEFPQIAD